MHSLDAFPRFLFIFFHCSFHAPGPRHVKEVMWSLFYECGRRDMCNDGLLLLGLDMSRQDFGKCGWEPKHALARYSVSPNPSILGISEVTWILLF